MKFTNQGGLLPWIVGKHLSHLLVFSMLVQTLLHATKQLVSITLLCIDMLKQRGAHYTTIATCAQQRQEI